MLITSAAKMQNVIAFQLSLRESADGERVMVPRNWMKQAGRNSVMNSIFGRFARC